MRRLITHVETPPAPMSDEAATATIHAALEEKALLPSTHVVDTGYVDAQLLVTSTRDYDVALVGPIRQNYRWQAQQGKGFAAEDFQIDWTHKQAVCPGGHTSLSWTPAADKWANAVIKIRFSTRDCRLYLLRPQCTQAKSARRTLTIRYEEQHKALLAARAHSQTVVNHWLKPAVLPLLVSILHLRKQHHGFMLASSVKSAQEPS